MIDYKYKLNEPKEGCLTIYDEKGEEWILITIQHLVNKEAEEQLKEGLHIAELRLNDNIRR